MISITPRCVEIAKQHWPMAKPSAQYYIAPDKYNTDAQTWPLAADLPIPYLHPIVSIYSSTGARGDVYEMPQPSSTNTQKTRKTYPIWQMIPCGEMIYYCCS